MQTTFEFPTASYNFTINRKVSARTTSLGHVCLAILMSRIVISTPYFYSNYGTLLLPSAGKYYNTELNINHVLQVQHCSSRKDPLCTQLEPALKKKALLPFLTFPVQQTSQAFVNKHDPNTDILKTEKSSYNDLYTKVPCSKLGWKIGSIN